MAIWLDADGSDNDEGHGCDVDKCGDESGERFIGLAFLKRFSNQAAYEFDIAENQQVFSDLVVRFFRV